MKINLTEKDKLKLKREMHIYVKHVDLSCGKFYAKYCSEEEMFKELLGKKIADIIGVKCPDYYIVKEQKCILSEDLNVGKTFHLASELKENGLDIVTLNDLYGVLKYHSIKYNCYTNVEDLMSKVKIVHFIDILFSNVDRHARNYGFILNDGNTGSLAIFDNSDMLNNFDKATRPLSFEKASHLTYTRYSKEAEFMCFLEICGEDIKEAIYTLTDLFSLKNVGLIMDSIESENQHKFECKKRLLLEYLKNYLMIKKVLFLEKIKGKKQKIK